jgi:hypothetical protein
LRERYDLDSETRVGKPWSRRIQREQFQRFSSKFPGRNGDEARTSLGREFRRKNQKERKRRTIFITCERGTSQKKDLGEKEQKLKQKLTINLKERF